MSRSNEALDITSRIQASVGMYNTGTTPRHNLPGDVKTIIDLLNSIPGGEGGKKDSAISASGVSPKILYDSIRIFQQKQNGLGKTPRLSVDGHVDPGGQTLNRLNALAGGKPAPQPYFLRARPPFVAQVSNNTCWAAAFEMWQFAELGHGWRQGQLIASAPDFSVGPSGIQSFGLKQVVNEACFLLPIKMAWVDVGKVDEVPDIGNLIRTLGYVYLAFTRPDGRGKHVNILFGVGSKDGKNIYDFADPDPSVKFGVRSHDFYFARFPALVGWRVNKTLVDYL